MRRVERLKVSNESMLLYVVTDRGYTKDKSLEKQVEESIEGGATFVQLREKNLSFEEFLEIGKSLKSITDKYNIPFVINDNIEVALELNADGVHVGQSDMNAKDCRRLIGEDKILGVSAQTVEQAILAEKNGADYIGVGAVFKTNSKDDADDVSFETLREITASVSIPVVAIGGISKENILKLKGSNIDGVALISAIFSSKDIKGATEEMRKLSKEITR